MKSDIRKVNETQSKNVATYLDLLLTSDLKQVQQASSRAAGFAPSTAGTEETPPVIALPPNAQDKPQDDDEDTFVAVEHKTERTEKEPPQPALADGGERPVQTAQREIRAVPRSHKEPTRSVRQMVAAISIPVLAAVLLLLVRKPLKGPAAASAAAPAAAPSASQTADNADVDWQIPPLYEANERDPMRLKPPVVQEAETPAPGPQARESIVVKGILYSEDRPAAVVGTRVLHVGDVVSGATVAAIARDGVEFDMNGQRWKQPVSDSD